MKKILILIVLTIIFFQFGSEANAKIIGNKNLKKLTRKSIARKTSIGYKFYLNEVNLSQNNSENPYYIQTTLSSCYRDIKCKQTDFTAKESKDIENVDNWYLENYPYYIDGKLVVNGIVGNKTMKLGISQANNETKIDLREASADMYLTASSYTKLDIAPGLTTMTYIFENAYNGEYNFRIYMKERSSDNKSIQLHVEIDNESNNRYLRSGGFNVPQYLPIIKK